MSRTRVAAFGSAFSYAQTVLALVSGFVLFPLIIWRIGVYDNGLWLMTGEMVGYLFLGDLGVLAVLPWLIAACHGAGDHQGIGRLIGDALVIAGVVGLGILAIAAGVWWVSPEQFGIGSQDWAKIRGPLALLLVLTGIGFPLRVFGAILVGLQDVVFGGISSLIVSALSITFTAILLLSDWGLLGLALAAGAPQLLGGLAASVRVFGRYREMLWGIDFPGWAGCRALLVQGFGAWLGGLGVRLLMASNSLVFAALGRPDWATIYAGTGKLAQVAQPMCWIVPDSALVGLSQLAAERDSARTQRTVICLLLLYLLIPGVAAVAILLVNPWFVRAWLGPSVYGGDYLGGLIGLNLVIGSAVSGLFKVVGVVGYRFRIGVATVVYGVVSAIAGYALGLERGMVGLIEGSLLAGVAFAIPFGVYALRTVHGIRPRELLTHGVARWGVVTIPILVGAGWVGARVVVGSPLFVAVIGLSTIVGYTVLLQPVIARTPWPERVRGWLQRFRLVPRGHSPVRESEAPR